MTFKRPTLPRKQRDAGEFNNYVPRPRAAVSLAPAVRLAIAIDQLGPPAKATQKLVGRFDRSIRESARGEECLVRIPGVCKGGTEHTIWSHAPLGCAGKGMGIKALDICGAMCCTACDAALDQAIARPAEYGRDEILLAWFYGHMRSLVRLRERGLL